MKKLPREEPRSYSGFFWAGRAHKEPLKGRNPAEMTWSSQFPVCHQTVRKQHRENDDCVKTHILICIKSISAIKLKHSNSNYLPGVPKNERT